MVEGINALVFSPNGTQLDSPVHRTGYVATNKEKAPKGRDNLGEETCAALSGLAFRDPFPPARWAGLSNRRPVGAVRKPGD